MNTLFVTFSILLIPLVSCMDGGTFTTNCEPLTIQRSDPIVTPGVASSHVHAVIGGNAFRRSMNGTYATQATGTTCDKALDHSNYWVPQLYHRRADGMFEMVKFSGSAVYYQLRACDYAPGVKTCDYHTKLPLAFPDGFRMVAGDPMRRTMNESDFAQTAISFMCIGTPGNSDVHTFPKSHCDQWRSQVYFPSCWNGIDLDVPDHKSHVAYPAIGNYNGGVCPKSHPVAIFSIFYEFYFEVGQFPDLGNFVFANGDPTGLGYHGDFIMGWTNRTALQHAHAGCITSANCPNLGSQPRVARPLLTPAIYEEEIGLNGPISKLPGNNPITNGPTFKN